MLLGRQLAARVMTARAASKPRRRWSDLGASCGQRGDCPLLVEREHVGLALDRLPSPPRSDGRLSGFISSIIRSKQVERPLVGGARSAAERT